MLQFKLTKSSSSASSLLLIVLLLEVLQSASLHEACFTMMCKQCETSGKEESEQLQSNESRNASQTQENWDSSSRKNLDLGNYISRPPVENSKNLNRPCCAVNSSLAFTSGSQVESVERQTATMCLGYCCVISAARTKVGQWIWVPGIEILVSRNKFSKINIPK